MVSVQRQMALPHRTGVGSNQSVRLAVGTGRNRVRAISAPSYATRHPAPKTNTSAPRSTNIRKGGPPRAVSCPKKSGSTSHSPPRRLADNYRHPRGAEVQSHTPSHPKGVTIKQRSVLDQKRGPLKAKVIIGSTDRTRTTPNAKASSSPRAAQRSGSYTVKKRSTDRGPMLLTDISYMRVGNCSPALKPYLIKPNNYQARRSSSCVESRNGASDRPHTLDKFIAAQRRCVAKNTPKPRAISCAPPQVTAEPSLDALAHGSLLQRESLCFGDLNSELSESKIGPVSTAELPERIRTLREQAITPSGIHMTNARSSSPGMRNANTYSRPGTRSALSHTSKHRVTLPGTVSADRLQFFESFDKLAHAQLMAISSQHTSSPRMVRSPSKNWTPGESKHSLPVQQGFSGIGKRSASNAALLGRAPPHRQGMRSPTKGTILPHSRSSTSRGNHAPTPSYSNHYQLVNDSKMYKALEDLLTQNYSNQQRNTNLIRKLDSKWNNAQQGEQSQSRSNGRISWRYRPSLYSAE